MEKLITIFLIAEMGSPMITRKLIRKSLLILLTVIIFASCVPKQIEDDNLPTVIASDTQTATQQTTPTNTVEPTMTSVPTSTPTTPPPQPAPLTSENIQNIQMISSFEFFQLGSLKDAEWSPDGEVLAVTTEWDFQIVNAKTLEILFQVQDYEFIRFLDDSNILLQDEQGLPVILDKQSFDLNQIDTKDLATDWGYSASTSAISYNGKTIASVSNDGKITNKITLTDVESGESTEFIFYLHDNKLITPMAVTFSPDGHFLYVTSAINERFFKLIIFDLELRQLLSQHSEFSRLPIFSPDSKRLVFYTSLYTSILGPWNDLETSYAYIKSVEERASGREIDYAFVQNSSKIGLLYQGTVHNYVTDDYHLAANVVIYNTNDNSVDHIIDDINSTSFKLGFSPDGKQFFTLSEEGYIQIWSTSDGELLCTSQAYKPNSNLVFSPDGTMFAYTIGNTVRFINVADGDIITELSDPDLTREKSLAFQGNDIIAINRDQQIDTFEILTGEWVRNYPHLGYCNFNQTGTTLVCSFGDFELYDASTGRALIKVRPESSYRYAVSDDGAYTAFCNYGSETVFLYDNQKGTQIQFMKFNNQPACGSMDFSGDGQLLVSSVGAIWQIPSGDLVMEMRSLGYGVMSVSPNNEFVLVYPGIYSLEDGSMLTKIESFIEWVTDAWFLPDGFNIIVLGENELQIWGVLE